MSQRESTLMSQKGGMLMSEKLNTLIHVTQKWLLQCPKNKFFNSLTTNVPPYRNQSEQIN